jgi:hypothetical protein
VLRGASSPQGGTVKRIECQRAGLESKPSVPFRMGVAPELPLVVSSLSNRNWINVGGKVIEWMERETGIEPATSSLGIWP